MTGPDDLRTLLARVALRDPSAAPDVRRLARNLDALADALEAGADEGGTASPGGATDRVQMTVTGPDGNIRGRVDTSRN